MLESGDGGGRDRRRGGRSEMVRRSEVCIITMCMYTILAVSKTNTSGIGERSQGEEVGIHVGGSERG